MKIYRYDAKKADQTFVRSEKAWEEIFATQTDGSPEQIAERIFGDLLCYNARDDRKLSTDVACLANALRVFWWSRTKVQHEETNAAA